MSYKGLRVFFLLAGWVWITGCAPSGRDSMAEPESEPDSVGVSDVSESLGVSPGAVQDTMERTASAEAAEAPVAPRQAFDPENPDWPLRYQELYEGFLARFEAPALASQVQVQLEGGRELDGVLLELGEKDVLLSMEGGELRVEQDMMQPRSQAVFFAEAYAQIFARHRARQEYEAWQATQAPTPAPASGEVAVRPRTTGGGTDALHAPRRVRRDGQPPVNEPPTGRVRQVEEYILRHAGSPESLQVHTWGRVQPHGDGFTVRVRYSLEGAAGFGLSNEDMIFFMYADGTVYQRAAYRGP